MNNEIISTSPDGRHEVRLRYKGEIRFGPPFFRLDLNGKILSGRVFGEIFCWSDDSRYLAAQEWPTTDYQAGPITRVLLVDLETNRYSKVGGVEKGFAEDFRFDGDIFIYRKHLYETDQVIETKVDVSSITNLEHGIHQNT